MEFLERLLLRGDQYARWLEMVKIPQLKDELDRRTKAMIEIREVVKQARETGDEDAFVRLTALAFPLKGKD